MSLKDIQALIATGVRKIWIPDEIIGWRQCAVLGEEDKSLWCKDIFTGVVSEERIIESRRKF